MWKRMMTVMMCAVLLLEGHEGQVYAAEKAQTVVSTESKLIQEGALHSAAFWTVEEEVLQGETWQAALRELIVSALDNYEMVVDISMLQIPIDDIQAVCEVYWDTLNSYPQYFYMSGRLLYSCEQTLYCLILNPREEYTVNGETDLNKIKRDSDVYESRVKNALSYVKAEMSDLEKALALHDYLVRECDYDYENYLAGSVPWESYSAYGALVENTAVCNGYGLAYGDLLRRVGISSVFVSSDAMNHAWNMALIDGSWYHVDATWDDPVWLHDSNNNDFWKEGYVGHTYFAVSDEEIIALNHSGWKATDCPTADKSGTFTGYCFDNINTASYYLDGYWYYLDEYYGNLLKCDVDCSEKNETPYSGLLYAHAWGDSMYMADFAGIYRARVTEGEDAETVVLFADTEYSDYILSEFTIKSDNLIAVLYNSSTDEYKRVSYPITETAPSVQKVTVRFDTQGGPEVASSTVELGSPVAEPAAPVRDGYRFIGWYKEADCVNPWNFSAEIVTDHITIYAGWEKLVNVTFDSCGGSSIEGQNNLEPGSLAKEPTEPIREGYHFTGWYKETSCKTAWDFKTDKVTEDVTIYAGWKKIGVEEIFPDIRTSDWYYGAVQFAYDNGIMKGKGDGTFAPAGKLTRAEFVTTLYNMQGKPEIVYEDCFTDVLDGEWFTSPIVWANRYEVAKGYGSRFGVADNITREQIVVMMYQYAEKVCLYQLDIQDDCLEKYPDKGKVCSWAANAVKWAVTNKIISGDGNGYINPQDNASRAECAAILKNFRTKYKSKE